MLTDLGSDCASRTLRFTRIQSGIVESGNGSSSVESDRCLYASWSRHESHDSCARINLSLVASPCVA